MQRILDTGLVRNAPMKSRIKNCKVEKEEDDEDVPNGEKLSCG